jgi:hypothetical protein
MCGVLCGMDEQEDIADYGEIKKEFLKEKFGVETIPARPAMSSR